MSLYRDLLEAGIEVDNHASDLYFPITPQSTVLLQRYPVLRQNATTFTNQITQTRWYDVPFAYDPFWENVERITNASIN